MSGTQSVLDSMTAGILDRKAGKSVKAGLTPVKGEQPAATQAPLDGLPAIALLRGDVFPHDGGITEQVVHSARSIRDSLKLIANYTDQIEECLRSIEREAGLPEGGLSVETAVSRDERERAEQKEREAEADRKVAAARELDTPGEEPFSDRYQRLQAEAQRSAFTPDLDAPAKVGSAAPGWACPVHGASSTESKTSRKGRTYRVCTKCPEFEK